MSFSVIIPSRNVDNLRACVDAIRASGETARVIVVWDGLTRTDFRALWVSPDDKLELVRGVAPFCFARNVNIGIKAAGDDDVVLLNDDCLVPAFGTKPLTRLIEAVNASSVQACAPYGVVSPRVTSPAALQHSYPGEGKFPGRDGFEEITDVTRFKMIPFVCVAIRRQVLETVGLLDERFSGSVYREAPPAEAGELEVYGGEDDDYCYRVRQAGMRLGVLNTWVADHKTLKSTFRPDGKGRSVAGARQRFFEIHGFTMGSR